MDKLKNNFGVNYVFVLDENYLELMKFLKNLKTKSLKHAELLMPKQHRINQFYKITIIDFSLEINKNNILDSKLVKSERECNLKIDKEHFTSGKEVYCYLGQLTNPNSRTGYDENVFKMPKTNDFDFQSKIKTQLIAQHLAKEYS